MKAFVISDVHSFYNEMITALNNAGYDKENPDHMLISLGDLLDRGPDPIKCLDFVNSIPDSNKILISGNHEDLMLEAIQRGYCMNHDIHNGTDKTALALSGFTEWLNDSEIFLEVLRNKAWKQYINSVVDYYETSDYIFVHGWVPTGMKFSDDPKYKKLPELYKPIVTTMLTNWQEGDWQRAKWTNGMNAWNQGLRVPDKTIFCGHYHTSWGHCNLHNDGVEYLEKIYTSYQDPKTGNWEPHVNYGTFKDDGIVALDACTILSHQVNCEVIDNFPEKVEMEIEEDE